MTAPKSRPMKLFVWEGVLTDYTSGMMVAHAPDLKTARLLLARQIGMRIVRGKIRKYPHNQIYVALMRRPVVRSGKAAFSIYG